MQKFDANSMTRSAIAWIPWVTFFNPHLGSDGLELSRMRVISGTLAERGMNRLWNFFHRILPSGYDSHSHGKSQFLIGKPSINGPSIPWLC